MNRLFVYQSKLHLQKKIDILANSGHLIEPFAHLERSIHLYLEKTSHELQP